MDNLPENLTEKPLKLKGDWEGGYVVSNRELKNGWGSLPEGAFFVVRRNYGGLDLRSLGCDCCGMRLSINKVSENDVTYLGHPNDQ